MSQNLSNALQALDNAVTNLESEYHAFEHKARKKLPQSNQHDLFSGPHVNGAQAQAPENNIDTDAMARALDTTIARVEKLLGEGQAQNG